MGPIQTWSEIESFLGSLPEWQALLVIVIGSVTVALGIHIVGDVLIKRLTRRIKGELDDILLENLHAPMYVSAILIGAYLTRDVLTIDDRLSFGIEATILSLLTIIWAIALTRIGRLVSDEMTEDTDRSKSVVPIFQNVWTAIIVGGSAYLLLTFWAIDVTPLLASAGVIGIVVGFAARDTIANFFGSIALYTDGTYQVGDYIVVESGERGRVEDISIRSTVIRTRDDVLVTIPNAELNSAVIINESSPRARYRIRTRVGVKYGSDLEQVEQAMLEATDEVDLVLDHPRPRVRFREFGDSALELELLCWVYEPVHRGRGTHYLNKAVYERFQAEGIVIPFPQRSIRVEDGASLEATDGRSAASGAN